MATDEAVLAGRSQGFSPPTLRLYEWNPPTLSIGCFQNTNHNIIESCLSEGIPFVRRITGGRAVLHGDEITYSIICSENERLFAEGISGGYRIISGCLLEALKEIGVKAKMQDARCNSLFNTGQDANGHGKISCFHSPSRYEIIIDNKKLVGSAQRRFKRTFLQHGSILFGVDRELVLRLFGKESLSRMAWVGLYSNVKKDAFKTILTEKIKKGLNINLTMGGLNPYEVSLRDKLIEERYKTNMWNMHNFVGFGS
ncbi:MAG: lipoate--protein ligase family protein [Deltaproteobacteria bacterium]|nr:lipoate--protein ligase family protein [Deltaproteobacteria bacterium]